jgi:hypothetical protein
MPVQLQLIYAQNRRFAVLVGGGGDAKFHGSAAMLEEKNCKHQLLSCLLTNGWAKRTSNYSHHHHHHHHSQSTSVVTPGRSNNSHFRAVADYYWPWRRMTWV